MSVTGSKSLYIQVLVAVVIGALLGHFYPEYGRLMQPLGEAFVKLVRMVIAPIIFVTVVVGIAKLTDTSAVGRIGLKAIFYFEVLTTFSSLIGLTIALVVRPGAGVNADPHALNAAAVARFTSAPHLGVTEFLLNIIPDTVVGVFAKGDILPVLFFAVLFGIALAATLATLGGKIPVESIVLILGIDRFMSEARAITNLFGNAVATIVVARWEGTLDVPQARMLLAMRRVVQVAEPA